jgi:hypothetical protein
VICSCNPDKALFTLTPRGLVTGQTRCNQRCISTIRKTGLFDRHACGLHTFFNPSSSVRSITFQWRMSKLPSSDPRTLLGNMVSLSAPFDGGTSKERLCPVGLLETTGDTNNPRQVSQLHQESVMPTAELARRNKATNKGRSRAPNPILPANAPALRNHLRHRLGP